MMITPNTRTNARQHSSNNNSPSSNGNNSSISNNNSWSNIPKSPSLRSVSTIQNDLRTGRPSNYISTSANARNNRTSNINARRYSLNDFDLNKLDSFTKFNSEQVIDLMEREQDAIVLKLMKEIAALKEENRILKTNLSRNNSIRRSSSLSSSKSLTTSSSSPNTESNSSSKRSSLDSNLFASQFLSKEELPNDDSRKKFKRKSSNESQPLSHPSSSLSPTSNANSTEEENAYLRKKNESLKKEVNLLKRKLQQI